MWKDFFYFTRTERQGILILAVLCILVFIGGWLIPDKENTATNDTEKFKKEYAEFMASIQEKKERGYTHNSHFRRRREIVLTPFDPNTIDSTGFLNVGIPAWMAKNILRYRNKGGKFRRVEDFRKVYGLTQEQYATLQPYIRIAPIIEQKDTFHLYIRKAEKDTLKDFKYEAGTVVELNQADTTELKKIPGIGSGIARMITGYRKRLGGFYDIAQLEEIHLDVDKLRPWLCVTAGTTQRINLNKAGIERLRAHPYINFYQAKVIVEYRKKKRTLKSLKQLSLYEEFTTQDLERISHYVCFE